MCVVLITLLIEVDCEHFYCDFEEFLELAAAFARRVSPGGGRKTPAGHFSTAGVRNPVCAVIGGDVNRK